MPSSSLLLRNWERPLRMMIMESSQFIAYRKQHPCSNIMAEKSMIGMVIWCLLVWLGICSHWYPYFPFRYMYISISLAAKTTSHFHRHRQQLATTEDVLS